MPKAVTDFLAGGGEMGQRIRDHDWRATPLGPPAGWPQSLKTAVRIMLTSRQPIWLGWGKELTYLYNDPYKSIIGGKHPLALGKPISLVWREIWNDIGPMLATAMNGVEGTYVEQQLLIMERNGYPEETYYTFSYSPVPDDDGSVGGIICANTDDTLRMIGERQLTLLRELATSGSESRSWQQACERSAAALLANPRDLPFALIYTREPGDDEAVLSGACGVAAGAPIAPGAIALGETSPWPVSAVIGTHEPRLIEDLGRQIPAGLPRGAWNVPPRQAALLPISAAGETGRAGVLVVGLNPYRLFDESYRAFLTLAASQIGSSIANAQAYEEERKRAEALAEIDRAKTTFFSNVSHEFRTPLTLMMTPLEEVLAKPEAEVSPEARALLELAQRNSVRLLKLVNTLLDFTRIEAGRVQASYQPTDLAAFTAELAANFRSAMDRAGLALSVECRPLPQPVHVDRDMWEKVVLNLLSNAFKFTFSGRIGVHVGLSADGSRAELQVSDTGVGMPADELPRIFDRFRRVEGARGRSYEGSGIGLALVQELVKLHGGAIDVRSELGRGSTFTVGLPLGTAHLPAQRIGTERTRASASPRIQAYVAEALGWLQDQAGSAPELPDASATEDLGTMGTVAGAESQLVLLADDNADMRNYVQRLLRTAGFRVVAVVDGAAALEAARRLKPDLVLSDVMMPHLDGFSLLAALRQDPNLRETPVLLLSARAGEEAKVEGLGAGADDYLTKPFAARELVARVEVNLRLARIRRENARHLAEEAERLERLNQVATTIAAEIDLERTVQVVTDAATELSGAAFGAFFYNVMNAKGEAYTLYTLSGASREAFAGFPMPRNTAVFGPTFNGEGIVRSDDITRDPRYGRNAPYRGMPEGHLPVRSYLAAPVVSQSGEVIGGLFFGHPEAGRFDARAERLIAGIANQAAVAMDKARLYRSAQQEIERRTRVEEALRLSEQSLEQKVAERTGELATANARLRQEAAERERAEEALRQAQKMEAIGQLTGGVAHDFNNLLTIVIGNLETMRRRMGTAGGEPMQVRPALEHALQGAQRAASLTQRLLAFSRRQPLDPKPLDINRLVTGMSELLRSTLGEHVVLQTVLSGGLWRTHADPNQLESAILNLALNARDAMPEGGRLTIETANTYLDESYVVHQTEVLPGQYVVLCVTDTGIGMTREAIARAFEPFYTTKDAGHGTGLGLSQVYGFVKQSGGHVKIYSEVGQGTTVRLYFPRVDQGEDVVAPVDPRPAAGGTETILVAEDDPEVRATAVAMLGDLGYRVLQAKDAESALSVIDSGVQVDLLFTDVVMPGPLRSPELARKARARLPGIAVLFTSGYTENAIVHGGRLDAGVELLPKPYTREALARKLRHVLANQAQRNIATRRERA